MPPNAPVRTQPVARKATMSTAEAIPTKNARYNDHMIVCLVSRIGRESCCNSFRARVNSLAGDGLIDQLAGMCGLQRTNCSCTSEDGLLNVEIV